MRVRGMVALLLLASGCATTRVVNLDTGQGQVITYTPVESDPVEIDERDFKTAVAQLMLDMKLHVGLEEPEQDGRLSLLASSGGVVDGARGRTVSPSHERICRRQGAPDACLSLLAGGFPRGPMERRMMALFFAFDTVWAGVEEAVGDLANPAALRAMVVSLVGTALVMLVAPEPITKFIAIGLTASLIAYLGTGPVWNLGQGFLRLMEEAKNARGLSELEDSGHRFARSRHRRADRARRQERPRSAGAQDAGLRSSGVEGANRRGFPAIGSVGRGGAVNRPPFGRGAERHARTDCRCGGRHGTRKRDSGRPRGRHPPHLHRQERRFRRVGRPVDTSLSGSFRPGQDEPQRCREQGANQGT